MADYASVDDVRSRVGGRILTATSNPSETDVESMLDEAEAELLGCIIALGLAESSISTRGAKIMRHWLANYVSGWFRISYAAAGGDGGNEDGEKQVEEWLEMKKAMMQSPAFYVNMLGSGTTPDNAINAKSYVTDNTDGKSISDGDFDPVITTGEVF